MTQVIRSERKLTMQFYNQINLCWNVGLILFCVGKYALTDVHVCRGTTPWSCHPVHNGLVSHDGLRFQTSGVARGELRGLEHPLLLLI